LQSLVWDGAAEGSDDEQEDSKFNKPKTGKDMTPHEKFAFWKTTTPQDPTETSIPENDTPPHDLMKEADKDHITWTFSIIEETRNVDASVISAVAETPAYQWLVAMVKRNMTLTVSAAPVFDKIASVMASGLKFRRGRAALQPEQAAIVVHWNPEHFVQEQAYGSYKALRSVLVITGEALNGQMTNAAQYIQKTWPLTGPLILEGVVAAATRGREAIATSK